MKDIQVNKTNISLVCYSIFLVICFAITIAKAEVGIDTHYFIGNSRMIMEGYIPYIDFKIQYTPLVFYIMIIPYSLFGSSIYTAITTMTLVLFIDSYILYQILYRYTGSKIKAWYVGLIFLSMSFMFQGFYFVLEPFVLFFGLCALFFAQRKKTLSYILSGICCYLAFFCKQYGVGYLFLALFFTWGQDYSKYSFKNAFLVMLGFIVSLILSCAVIEYIGVPIKEQLSIIRGSGYQWDGIKSYMSLIVVMVKYFSFIIVAISLLLVNIRKYLNDIYIVVSLCAIGGFSIQGFVRPYDHYLQLSAPFMALMVLPYLNIIKEKKCPSFFQLLPLIPLLLFVPYRTFQLSKENKKNSHFDIASKLEYTLPKCTKNVYSMYSLLVPASINNYYPPCIEEYGMLSGVVEGHENINFLVSNATYIIAREKDLNNPYYCPKTTKQIIKDKFIQKAIIPLSDADYIYIYQKN